jgi:transcriptional regulator GlxA family with amidase domain
MVVRHDRIYTSGGAFAGLDLLSTLLIDLGFAAQERQVRKVMVLPPVRLSQSPYELPPPSPEEPFARLLDALATRLLPELDLPRLAKELAMSPRTLARRFQDELQTTPGKWIQHERLARASVLLESSTLTISEICDRVGYRDLSSFTRLFAKSTGVTPGEFRRSH